MCMYTYIGIHIYIGIYACIYICIHVVSGNETNDHEICMHAVTFSKTIDHECKEKRRGSCGRFRRKERKRGM